MSTIVDSIRAEYLRYKSLAERAVEQVTEEDLIAPGPSGGNSLATLCWHIAGNLRSRFTDFRTTDGEKPWRNRETEFLERTVTHEELRSYWEEGWNVLFGTLDELSDEDLSDSITIRGRSLFIHEALHRSLAHISYHVGQVVYEARARCGEQWNFLSIPPGESERYNAQPDMEKPREHTRRLTETDKPD